MNDLVNEIIPSQKLHARALGIDDYTQAPWTVSGLTRRAAVYLVAAAERHYGDGCAAIEEWHDEFLARCGAQAYRVVGRGLEPMNDAWPSGMIRFATTPLSCCLNCGRVCNYECMDRECKEERACEPEFTGASIRDAGR